MVVADRVWSFLDGTELLPFGHADVRITQKVYAPISGKFLAQEPFKLGRYLGPALRREASLPPIQWVGTK